MNPARLQLAAESVEAAPFEIPGATGGPFLVQILNEDAAKGVVATIVHLPPGDSPKPHGINLEDPGLFNRIVSGFLAQVDAGRWPERDPRATAETITGMR
jgi:hypothetical protein